MQEFYYKLAKGVLSAKLWYQSAFRDLPEPIISLPSSSGEKQKDRSFRSIISFESCSGGRRFEINAAMVYDYLNYINRLASIDSKNSSNSFFLTGTMETKIGTRTNLKADFKDELNIINSNNFSGQKTRNLVSTGAVAETVFSDRLQTRILVRESLQDSKFPFPDFSAGAQLRIFPERKYFISANFSRNSRIPSLNEMYWAPGGNPDLKNETGYLSEISVSADQRLSSEINIKSGITLFHNIICDMIEWRPGEFAYWEAENIGKTTTSGMETSVSLRYFTSGLNILLNTGYTLTIAENNSGKQLIYVPVNRINGAVRIEGKHFYSGIITDFTGRRFLDADNSSYLPPYFVNNLEMGTMLKIKDNPCSLSFTINNIFNVSYQNIAWYPMPGRALLVSAVFQFK